MTNTLYARLGGYDGITTVVENLLPREHDRRKLLWETPRKLFGFGN